MTSPVVVNLWNPNPFPPGLAVEALRQGDPRALIPCLKEHRSDYLPYYNAILNNPASKRTKWACEHFAEAVVYASYRLLPEVVEKLLSFPLHIPAPVNVQIQAGEPNRDVEHVDNNYPVHQFGFEEAIYIAISEAIRHPGKIAEAERIVEAILNQALFEKRAGNDPMDCFLHNSGPSDYETGYLDKSLEKAKNLGSNTIITVLKNYIDKYGVSSEEVVVELFDNLKDTANGSQEMLALSEELRDLLEKKRFRFLPKETHNEILLFAIENRLDNLISILLNPKRFKQWSPGKKEYVDCISQAVSHLSWHTILTLKMLVGHAIFDDYLESYWNEASDNPIITCLEAYLEFRGMQDPPDPLEFLELLFEFDEDKEETDYEELKGLYISLRDEMKANQCTHDQAVLNLIDGYRTISICDSDSD